MIEILESNLNDLKAVKISLKKIYGINTFQATLLCKKLGFCCNLKTKTLDGDQITVLTKSLDSDNVLLHKTLKKKKSLNEKTQQNEK